jgi:hypothetical protein
MRYLLFLSLLVAASGLTSCNSIYTPHSPVSPMITTAGEVQIGGFTSGATLFGGHIAYAPTDWLTVIAEGTLDPLMPSAGDNGFSEKHFLSGNIGLAHVRELSGDWTGEFMFGAGRGMGLSREEPNHWFGVVVQRSATFNELFGQIALGKRIDNSVQLNFITRASTLFFEGYKEAQLSMLRDSTLVVTRAFAGLPTTTIFQHSILAKKEVRKGLFINYSSTLAHSMGPTRPGSPRFYTPFNMGLGVTYVLFD